ncbi:cytoplasmic proline-tRNA ligase Prs1 [Gonapodya prolifera JEL478]|uniref:proline--tRNA ligase n=1 Tax=Gonapodya prolifera (strain JEL478) TaxID=1344416 RepID=A0A138ZXE3_GONPJ|nr:cytoplasmic proline-tRNA ligase Prs1 [Gonapodya prolifera JEL478]|eukprot:KXS09182.1 cytoplasmic proline-tRNA ligase Prs1 [Gonapodya prolifera JEL478]
MASDPAYAEAVAAHSEFELLSHASVENIKEWSPTVKGATSATLTKTLFVKPKTAKSDPTVFYMIVALETSEFSITAVGQALKLKEARIAAEDAIRSNLGVDKDHVTPFALAKLTDKSTVKVVVDSSLQSLAESTALVFRGLTSDKSVVITRESFQKYLDAVGNEVVPLDFSSLTGSSAASGPKASESKAEAPKKEAPKKAPASAAIAETAAKEATIGIDAKKEDDFSTWYQQVVVRSEMLDYYDISGCYILRPWAYKIWKEIQGWFGTRIEDLGVEDCYFPMFVSKRSLEREKDHIEGFAPEVAWVTKAGDSELEEHIAVRPTSETVMYPYYGKWIRSHRDLPLRLNQWNNVVRWEFKYPQPFLRTREFLWQEGHTVFATKEEAAKEVLEILDLYCRVYEELLAVPMVKGTKSEKEKFAGGLYTTTVEGFIPTTGRGIQGATSHCLGQNFAKMFDIHVLNEKQEKQYVWQNSWGLTTRTIGVMVMVHGDDKGLVLPPRVASIQVVVVPVGITAKATAEERASIENKAEEIAKTLSQAGIRVKSDTRDNVTPGFKFNHWELRGVPIRLEVGPKDLKANSVRSVLRYNGAASSLPLDGLAGAIKGLLEEIQENMFQKANAVRQSRTVRLESWNGFVKTLNAKNLVLVPWCEAVDCEDAVKERSAKETLEELKESQDARAPSMGAKSLCIPHEQPQENPLVPGTTKCFQCGKDAKSYTLFGRSY